MPEYIGKGYGKKLFKYAVNELKNLNFQDIFLWVLEENSRARVFYERNGFHSDGGCMDTEIGGKKLREIRYLYHVK